MAKWNEESAPNNNLQTETIQSSRWVDKPKAHDFTEELADGGERNRLIQKQAQNNIK